MQTLLETVTPRQLSRLQGAALAYARRHAEPTATASQVLHEAANLVHEVLDTRQMRNECRTAKALMQD